MRPTGRARVSVSNPQAHAICDRCGFRYNHIDLKWQFEWRGPKLQNIRRLVCQRCLDKPQENIRTIILPPDPVSIQNARPEDYVADNNPLSAIGANASPTLWQYGSQIGNLLGGGGVPAAFDSTINKPAWMSANNSISNSSYNNYVGINWAGDVSHITQPSSLMARVVKHIVGSFAAYAPNDRSFLGNSPTSYVVQGSPVDTKLYGAWTTIASGTTAGTTGESVSGACSGGSYQFHRFAILGDQLNFAAIAQVQFNVIDTGSFT